MTQEELAQLGSLLEKYMALAVEVRRLRGEG